VETKGYKRILHLPDLPCNPRNFSDFSTLNSIGWIFSDKNRPFMTIPVGPRVLEVPERPGCPKESDLFLVWIVSARAAEIVLFNDGICSPAMQNYQHSTDCVMENSH